MAGAGGAIGGERGSVFNIHLLGVQITNQTVLELNGMNPGIPFSIMLYQSDDNGIENNN